ncbi:hypothetical protein QE152_g6717 [Popillia japonica]|uniref:Uncharacterized protein n=1 Tax=Popillia japonica TaxID=7064 RepID=A0AAW1MDP7_POPJA
MHKNLKTTEDNYTNNEIRSVYQNAELYLKSIDGQLIGGVEEMNRWVVYFDDVLNSANFAEYSQNSKILNINKHALVEKPTGQEIA